MKIFNALKAEPGFYRSALALGLPIAFQNLLTSCATLIDTAMLVSLGNAVVSAMGVAARFSFLLNIICFGFASGCATLIAQYWGARQTDNMRRSLGFVLILSLSFGAVYMIALAFFPEILMRLFTDEPTIIALGAEYLKIFSIAAPFVILSIILSTALRSVQMVRAPLISACIAVAVNTSLNYCLIFGKFGFPELGLRGAAVATAVGCAAQTLFLIGYLFFSDNPYRARLSSFFKFPQEFRRKYLRISFPALLNETVWAIGTNVYVMVFARQGIEAHAGYTLYENVQQLFFVFFVGICGACSVMVGTRVGAGDREGGYQVARRFSIITPLFALVLGIAMVAVRDPLLSLFPVETEGARAVASSCLLFYGLWLAFRMIPYIQICGIFRAGGDTKAGCILDFVGLYVFGIPAVLVVGLLIRPEAFVVLLATMFIGEDFIKGVLCVLYFRSRKWIKQITSDDDAAPEQKTLSA